MDAQRALLDQLMGKDRDALVANQDKKKKRARRFTDEEVDKMYLVGCSPYELFRGTKSDLGPNPKVVDEKCKQEFDKLSIEEKLKYPYFAETKRFLMPMIHQCDYRIRRSKEHLCDGRESNFIDVDAKRVMDYQDQMQIIDEQIKKMAMVGEVDRAFQLMKKMETMRTSIDQFCQVPEVERTMIVCPVSGNLIARGDDDERIRSHFEGRYFKAWKTCRQFVNDVATMFQERGYNEHEAITRHRSSSGHRHDRSSRSRRRSSSRGRSDRRKRRRRSSSRGRSERRRSRSRRDSSTSSDSFSSSSSSASDDSYRRRKRKSKRKHKSSKKKKSSSRRR